MAKQVDDSTTAEFAAEASLVDRIYQLCYPVRRHRPCPSPCRPPAARQLLAAADGPDRAGG